MAKLSQESLEDINAVYSELYAEPTVMHPHGISVAEHLANYLSDETESDEEE